MRNAVSRARELRRQATVPEKILWNRLRAKRLCGVKFRRQEPIGPYFADFYCEQARLVVEVDGRAHASRQAHDRERDQYMNDRGIRVLRIPARDVVNRLDGVIEEIYRAVQEHPLSRPLPEGEEAEG